MAVPNCAKCLPIRPIAAPQKVAILDKLNAKMGLQRELRNLIAVLINNDRIADVHEVVAGYRAEMQERQGIRQAEIVTARELTEPGTGFAGRGSRQTGGLRRSRPPSSSTRASSVGRWCGSDRQFTTGRCAGGWSGSEKH